MKGLYWSDITVEQDAAVILRRSEVNGDLTSPERPDVGFGCIPVFHALSVEKIVDILLLLDDDGYDKWRQLSDQFQSHLVASLLSNVIHIAKAYHQTPMGVKYEIETGGCTVDSPEWVKHMCNNPDALHAAISELKECLFNDDSLRRQLYTLDLKTAIDEYSEKWSAILKSGDGERVISDVNRTLDVFTRDASILRMFGQGRRSKGDC